MQPIFCANKMADAAKRKNDPDNSADITCMTTAVIFALLSCIMVNCDFTPSERYPSLADCQTACLDPAKSCQQVRSWPSEWECLETPTQCGRLGNFASTVKSGSKVIRGPTWPGLENVDDADSCNNDVGDCNGECVFSRCGRTRTCVGVVQGSMFENCDPGDGAGCIIINVDWGCGGNPPNISTYQIGGNFCDVVECRQCFI